MTISALLLRQKFYDLNPSSQPRYATLALLFVNISVGGTPASCACSLSSKSNCGFIAKESRNFFRSIPITICLVPYQEPGPRSHHAYWPKLATIVSASKEM
ncbi:MAG: hypothetical protein JO076_10730, partial [Verrucomicrobia bacterium]|nr:hypothetical protein [Verrucomicrobiota bacterium]